MELQDIKKIMVAGAGSMGEGIAQNFAQAGLDVLVLDIDEESLIQCKIQIEANLHLFGEFGLVNEEIPTIMARIEFLKMNNLEEMCNFLDDIDFVVEAIPEILELKRDFFRKMDICREDIVLCSNTSSLTVSEISKGLIYPGRVVGLHYFYPANIIPLVEIHRGEKTGTESVELTRELMLKVGKQPILVRKEIPGLIVNRIQAAYNREVTYLMDEGVATPEDLDLAARASYGFRLACLGPLEIHDLNGLDVVLKAGGRTRKYICNSREHSPSLVKKVEAGELGVKTGKGWHDYKGSSREEIIEQTNRKLLQQLILFNTQKEANK
jgi:3-hydroxyacyl-CoA dehydrogenase